SMFGQISCEQHPPTRRQAYACTWPWGGWRRRSARTSSWGRLSPMGPSLSSVFQFARGATDISRSRCRTGTRFGRYVRRQAGGEPYLDAHAAAGLAQYFELSVEGDDAFTHLQEPHARRHALEVEALAVVVDHKVDVALQGELAGDARVLLAPVRRELAQALSDARQVQQPGPQAQQDAAQAVLHLGEIGGDDADVAARVRSHM